MSQLIVVAFDDKHRADEVLLHLLKLEQAHLSAFHDAVVVTKNAEGKVRVKAYHDLLGPIPELSNDMWGGVISAVVFHRSLGIAQELFAPQFLTDVEAALKPNNSALMVLVQEPEIAKVEQELANSGGKLFSTALPDAHQDRIQAAMR